MSDEAKRKILARRARFLAATIAATGVACGGSVEEPSRSDASNADTKVSSPDACLGVSYDSGPGVCLSAPYDSTTVDGKSDTSASDTGPTPCLEPPYDAESDAEGSDTGPTPCLEAPSDGSFD